MPRLSAKIGQFSKVGKFALLGLVLFGLTACPQPGAGGEGDGGLGGIGAILPLVLIFVVFYFLLIRPQQKKQKAHKQMLSEVRRGDDVVTNGGIVGHVIKSRDENLLVEIAPGVRVRVMRTMISEVIRRPDPDFDEDDEDDEEFDERYDEELEDDEEFEEETQHDDSSEKKDNNQ